MKLGAILGLVGLVGLTATSPAIDLRPSTHEQIRLGQDVAAQIRKEEKLLPDDDERVQIMRRIADRLLATIPAQEKERRPWKYSFDIVDSDEINAFALPGGPIFFYRGLVDKFETEDQFAGVLGHEIAHVRHTHWASQYADNLRRRLGIGLLLGLTGASRDLSTLVDVGDTLAFMLPYSRRHETEADKSGFDLMVAAGYNPQGMVDVFRKFQEMKQGQGAPEFISTHPNDRRRVQDLQALVQKSGRTFAAQRPLPWANKKSASEPNRSPQR